VPTVPAATPAIGDSRWTRSPALKSYALCVMASLVTKDFSCHEEFSPREKIQRPRIAPGALISPEALQCIS
jgi:hypothetical protein